MKNKTTLLILFITLILAGGIYATIKFVSKPKQQYTDTTTKEPELGGPKEITLTNTAKLSDILLTSQLQATRQAVSIFLLEYLDPNTTSAAIISEPIINNDGSVQFTVKSQAPVGKKYSFERKDPESNYVSGKNITGTSVASTTFTVLVSRSTFKSITVNISEYNYTTVVPL